MERNASSPSRICSAARLMRQHQRAFFFPILFLIISRFGAPVKGFRPCWIHRTTPDPQKTDIFSFVYIFFAVRETAFLLGFRRFMIPCAAHLWAPGADMGRGALSAAPRSYSIVSPCPSPRPFYRLCRIVTTRALCALSSGAIGTEVDRRSEQIAVRPGPIQVQNITVIPIDEQPVPCNMAFPVRHIVTGQRMILVLRRQRLWDPQDLDDILEQIHFITPLFTGSQIPLELC